MARTGRSFPLHPNTGQRQALAVPPAPPATLPPRTTFIVGPAVSRAANRRRFLPYTALDPPQQRGAIVGLSPFNTFEGGTSGTTITTANSGGTSGTAWDAVQQPTGGSITFDNTHTAHGGMAALLTGGSTGPGLNWKPQTIGLLADGYGRAYFYITALPAAQARLVRFFLAGTGGPSIELNTTGTVEIDDAAHVQQAVTTNTVPLNAWWRIEWHHNASAQLVVRLYLGDSTTITEQITAAANTATSVDEVHTLLQVGAGNMWMDDVNAGVSTWPGPASPGLPARPAYTVSSVVGVTAWRCHRRSEVIDPRPNVLGVVTKPPQTIFAYQTAIRRRAYRPFVDIVEPRPAGLPTLPPAVPPHPPSIVLSAALMREARRPKTGVLEPRPSGLLFTVVVATPPRPASVIILAAPFREARRPKTSVIGPRPAGLPTLPPAVPRLSQPILVSPAAFVRRGLRGGHFVFIRSRTQDLPPRGVILGFAAQTRRHPRGGDVAFTRGIFVPVIVVFPPRPVIVNAARIRRPTRGRVTASQISLRASVFVAPSLLSLFEPSLQDHAVSSNVRLSRIVVGHFTFSSSYPTGGDTFTVPGVRQAIIVNVPAAGGYTFSYTAGKLKAYTGSGAEVSAGTDLSVLGSLPWYSIAR